MALDLLYVIQSTVVLFVVLVLFSLSFLIYQRTKGGSLFYKVLTLGMGFLLVQSSIHTFASLVLGLHETSESLTNEFVKTIAPTFGMLGYFYIPLAILHIAKDMGFGDLNQETILKIRNIFFIGVIVINWTLFAFAPFFSLVRLMGFIHMLMYFGIWLFSLYIYNQFYRDLISLTGNSCWNYIYTAIVGGLFNSGGMILYFAGLEFLYIFTIVAMLVLAVSILIGFFKLAKMLEAI